MQLSAPKQITWWIALIVGVVGLIANFVTIPVLSALSFWLVVVALALLLLATLIEGL
jgi:heme/copper-type cytochrome/quinol oxidase subunit 1